MTITSSGIKLESLIKKAIDDGEISAREYEEIFDAAYDDHHIDSHEKVLLRELREMIANKQIRRVV
jgi:hypothetical protein